MGDIVPHPHPGTRPSWGSQDFGGHEDKSRFCRCQCRPWGPWQLCGHRFSGPSGRGHPPPRNGQATFSLYKFLLVPSALVTQGPSNPASLEGTLCERGVSPRWASQKGGKTPVPRAPPGGADGHDSIKAESDPWVFNGRSCNRAGAPTAPPAEEQPLRAAAAAQRSGVRQGQRAQGKAQK